MKKKHIAAVTLGCKVNYAETSSIVDMLVQRGAAMVDLSERADIVIIHTCAVTAEAERKSRQQIRKIIRSNPESRVVVTGCYAQLAPERIASIEGVSLVLGMSEKYDMSLYEFDVAGQSVPIYVSPASDFKKAHIASSTLRCKDKRTRAFLKIQDGCSSGCSYCTIPVARGRSRSVALSEVIDRAGRLAEAGYREIVLTGINIADYRDGKTGFSNLLRLLESIDVERIRISSIEPELLDDEIISIVSASGKIMPHFHLPLQSGSDRVLGLMGRHYDTKYYRERLLKAVSAIPCCAVGADVMVGYPGESEEDFEEMYAFIEGLPVAYLHVFSCSVRPNTRLAKAVDEGRLKRVSSVESASRSKRLGVLGDQIERRFAASFIGCTLMVLFEERHEAADGTIVWSGYSENYLRVDVAIEATIQNQLMKGSVRSVIIQGFGEGLQLQGRLLS